ncbi:MAG TPA: ABC transporter permease [Frankiaceae bacterium]|nr:ABC transporter permease [Frankiaceae bacterium]
MARTGRRPGAGGARGPVWAITVKELREVRRDRRTLAMMIVLPVLLLVVFGYAASFDVSRIRAVVTGPAAAQVARRLPPAFSPVEVRPAQGRADAVRTLRHGAAVVAVVTGPSPAVLVDGSKLFEARAVVTGLGRAGGLPAPEVLFNPGLKTSTVMVPAIMGIILVFVGTMTTSLGVVRERQTGTLEQLAVMPFRPRDVFVGKVAPYFLVACLDTAVVLAAGRLLFGVPFRGSPLTFLVGALLFLFVTLGLGVLVSSVSENQGQAIQLAIMTMLPQVLLSGLIFPIPAMAAGVRWIAYLLPLTYFNEIARGVLVRGAPAGSLWFPLLMLAVLGAAAFGLSVARFRRDLAPERHERRGTGPDPRTAHEPGTAR